MSHQSLKVLFVCLAAIVTTNAASIDRNDGRIVGGQAITIDQTPYLMQLRLTVGQFCGGALVGPRHVVTAAHCVDDVSVTRINVVGAATYTSDKGVSRKVIKKILHENYQRDSIMDFDIAVLILESDMTGENITTIPLCTKQMEEGDMMQVSGWGKTNETGVYPQKLFTTFIPTISREDCIVKYKQRITNSMVCAFGNYTDSCTGDSGGPAVNDRGELSAVVSWGMGCARANRAGVYAGITESKEFLDYALSQY